jgi:hypothetical protein
MSDVDKVKKMIDHYKRGLIDFEELCLEVEIVSFELAMVIEYFMVEFSNLITAGEKNV